MPFEPAYLDPDQGHCRCIWMHPQVAQWVGRSGVGKNGNDYYARIREFLKGFVIGHDFDDDTQLKCLKPEEEAIWELRVQFEPKARILGGFLEPCVFIATNYKDRTFLHMQGFSGERKRCKAIWDRLFPNHPRMAHLTRDQLLEWQR